MHGQTRPTCKTCAIQEAQHQEIVQKRITPRNRARPDLLAEIVQPDAPHHTTSPRIILRANQTRSLQKHVHAPEAGAVEHRWPTKRLTQNCWATAENPNLRETPENQHLQENDREPAKTQNQK